MRTNPIVLFLALALHASAEEIGKDTLAEEGKAAFASCMACHGLDGKGMAAGPKKLAPSLSASPIVTGDPAFLTLVITKGIAKESQDYLGIMTPMEAVVATDRKLAAVLTYLRTALGNNASAVTPEEAKALRDKWQDIKVPVTRAKLEELEEASRK